MAGFNWNDFGNFGVNFIDSQYSKRDRQLKQQQAEDDRQYQEYLRKVAEEEQKRRDQEYKNSRLTMNQDLYNSLGGSPQQAFFAPTTALEQSYVPENMKSTLSQYGVSTTPKTSEVTNWGEVSKEDYFNALKDSEARKKEAANNITLTQEMIDQAPEMYRKYFQPGQTIGRNEWMGMIPVSQPLSAKDQADIDLKKSEIWRNYNYFPGNENQDQSYTSKMLKNYNAEKPKIDTGQVYPNQTPIFKNESLQSYASRTGGAGGERQYLYEQSGNQDYLNPNRTIFGVQNKQDPTVDEYIKTSSLGSIEATVRKAIQDRKPGPFITKLIQRAGLSGYPTDPAVWQNAVLNNTKVTKKKTVKK